MIKYEIINNGDMVDVNSKCGCSDLGCIATVIGGKLIVDDMQVSLIPEMHSADCPLSTKSIHEVLRDDQMDATTILMVAITPDQGAEVI